MTMKQKFRRTGGGFMSILLLLCVIWGTSPNDGTPHRVEPLWIVLFGLLAAITGLTAALHITLKHPRIQIPPTKN